MTSSVIVEAIGKVVRRENLSLAEAEAAMNVIMTGDATQSQIAGFLVGLRMKGETIDEIAGCARAMRRNARPVVTHQEVLVDTCGTGGDGARTFNISTTTAFVVAGAGVPVAKHGNRAVSSQCGSADVLQELGVRIDLTPEQVGACIDEIGIGFLFAPTFHPAMKHAIGPRRELGLRTIFNILGPLTNPAGAGRQVMGVYDRSLTEPLAEVLNHLGSQGAFVVHGPHGLDELTTTGCNWISQLAGGQVKTYELDPITVKLVPADPADLTGGSPRENAAITRAILSGQPASHGARRDAVLLNAAAALVAAERAADLRDGLQQAGQSIDSGAALAKLEQLVAFGLRADR